MEIVRRTIQRSGRDVVVAWIDTKNVDMGLDTISSGYDEEALDKTEIGPDEPILKDPYVIDLDQIYFFIDTYRKLVEDPQTTWDALLQPVNGFLQSLSPEDSKLMFLFYVEARKIIDEEIIVLHHGLSETAVNIGNRLYDLAETIDLPAKLLYHCRNHGLPVPDLSYAGTQIGQHREEMTFREDDYYLAMAVSVLCKLLFPIWGDLIYHTTKITDTSQKEVLSIDVIVPVLNTKLFKGISDKLYNYVANIVETSMAKSYANASFTATIKGFSQNRFHQIVFATMLIRRYVNVNFYADDGNLMTWTSSSAKNAFNSQLQTLTASCQVMKRIDISDQPSSDEENSVSILEHSSRITTVTADIPILIKLGIKQSLKSICREYLISELEINNAMNYYLLNPIQVTYLNKIMVGILLGNKIGGARGLRYLNHIDYMRLVVITQIYAANHVNGALAHLLTATRAPLAKTAFTIVDTRITTTFRETGEYRECTENTYIIDDISVASIIAALKDQIVKNNHLANTAPNVSTIMDESPLVKNTPIEYDEMIMRNLCSMVLHILNKENHQLSGM